MRLALVAAALLGTTTPAASCPHIEASAGATSRRGGNSAFERARTTTGLQARTQHSKSFPPVKELDFECDSDSADKYPSNGASAKGTSANGATKVSLHDLVSWRAAELTLTVDGSYPRSTSALVALQAAIDTWTSAASELPVVNIRLADDEFLETGDDASQSEHRLYFAAHGHPRTNGALAVTVTTVDTEHAEILDGDIIVDGTYRYPDLEPEGWDDESPLWYDLQSVLTHELGHWFGLPEDYCNPDATMYAYTRPGETIKRDLAQSDIIEAQVAYWQADNPSGQVSCNVLWSSSRSGFGLPFCAVAFALWVRTQRSRANRKPQSEHGRRA